MGQSLEKDFLKYFSLKEVIALIRDSVDPLYSDIRYNSIIVKTLIWFAQILADRVFFQ